MKSRSNKISLGFTCEHFNPGIHICQIFNDDNERHDALMQFVLSGLQSQEKTACFSEKETETTISSFLEKNGISYSDVQESGNFTFDHAAKIYFENDVFDPDRMLILLEEFYKSSVEQKNTGARVIGEMSAEIEHIPGGSRLMEYESKVSILLKKYPVTSVCQYDARLFDGSTLFNILKVHPFMIIRGSVIHNPFFIQPEDYLSGKLL
jgi:hypothetical protein